MDFMLNHMQLIVQRYIKGCQPNSERCVTCVTVVYYQDELAIFVFGWSKKKRVQNFDYQISK